MEGPLPRAPHNHITQVKPRRIRYDAEDCPACASIDLEHMEDWYAAAWYTRLKVDRDRDFMERALRE